MFLKHICTKQGIHKSHACAFNNLRKLRTQAIKPNAGKGNDTSHPFLCILKAVYCVCILEQNMLVLVS